MDNNSNKPEIGSTTPAQKAGAFDPTQNAEREFINLKQAIAMLPDGDKVHTFRQNALGTLVGADYAKSDIIDALERHRPEIAGETAQSIGHGLVFEDERGFVFVETKIKG